jgi:hypothetical protein
MSQYIRLFGITRVPKPGTDILVGSHPVKARHILVIYQDQLFSVDVFEAGTGARISIASIQRCVSIAVLGIIGGYLIHETTRWKTIGERDTASLFRG